MGLVVLEAATEFPEQLQYNNSDPKEQILRLVVFFLLFIKIIDSYWSIIQQKSINSLWISSTELIVRMNWEMFIFLTNLRKLKMFTHNSSYCYPSSFFRLPTHTTQHHPFTAANPNPKPSMAASNSCKRMMLSGRVASLKRLLAKHQNVYNYQYFKICSKGKKNISQFTNAML